VQAVGADERDPIDIGLDAVGKEGRELAAPEAEDRGAFRSEERRRVFETLWPARRRVDGNTLLSPEAGVPGF
jgi:hypothetical protein